MFTHNFATRQGLASFDQYTDIFTIANLPIAYNGKDFILAFYRQ